MSDQYDAPNPEPGSATAVAPAPAYAPPNPEPKVPNQPQLPVGDVPTAYSAPNPEQARQNVMALSPDPAQADAKIQASKAIGDWLKIHPVDVHQNFDAVTQHIYGDSVKGQTPATIFQKVQNTFKGQQLAAQDADLAGKMFLGDDSQATKDARSAVKKQQAELGPTLGWLPQQAAGIAFQLGYQVEHATDTVAYTGLSILSGELLAKTLGMNPKTHFLEAAVGESQKVFGSLVGGSYGSLIDRGVDPTYARMAATGLGALQIGLMAIPIGQEASKPVGDALIDGVIRPMLNGAIDKTAATAIPKAAAGKLGTTLGMDAATAETAGAFGKQGLMAVGMATANAALPEVAASLSNRLKDQQAKAQEARLAKSPGLLTPGNIDIHARPTVQNEDGSISTVESMSFEERGKEILVPTISDDGKHLTDDQAIALYHKTGKHFGIFDNPEHADAYAQLLHEEQANEYGKTKLKSAGELATEITEGAVGQFLVAGGAVGAHEALRSMVQTHIENAVSAAADRELAKQAQEARFEEAVKAATEKAKAAEIPQHPIEAATREMQAKQTIGDIVDREPQLPEVKPAEDPYAAQLEAETAKKTTVSDEQLKAMLDKAKEAHGEDIKMPGVTKDWHDAVRMDPNDEGKAVLWYNDAEGGTHAIVEPLEAKATERPSTGNGGVTNPEPATRPVTPAMSEEQGRVLDEATRSEEGTSDYIERRPDVQALNKKISDLQLAVDQGKTEGKAALEAARAEKTAAVKSLRDQIKTRAQTNKDLADIKAVVAGAKYMNRDLGDAVKALGEKLDLKGKTSKANLTKDYLSELSAVHDALVAEPDRGPTIDLGKLKDLSRVKARDLSPEDLSDVTDALKNLAWVQRMRDKVQDTGKAIELDGLRKEATEKVQGLKFNAEEQARADSGARAPLARKSKEFWRDAKSTGNTGFAGYDFNAQRVFGGKDTENYRIVSRNLLQADLRREPHANALLSPVMDDWLSKDMGINRRTQPLKYIKYATEQFTEDGFTLDRGDIMSAYMHYQAENNKASLLSGAAIASSIDPNRVIQIPDETYQKFFSHLDPKEIKMMKEIAARDLLKAGDERAKEFENRYGYPMSREQNYWPKNVVRDADVRSDIEALRKSMRWVRAAPDESHSIERTGAKGPIRLRNFFEVYPEVMADTAHVVEMGPVVGEAGKILWDPKISETVKQRQGAPVLNGMRDDLKFMAGQGNTSQWWEKGMDGLGNVITSINLANNVKSAIKQALLAGRSFTEVRADAWLKGAAYVATHPRKAQEAAEAVSMFVSTARRKGGTLEQSQMLNTEGGLQTFKAVRTQVKKAGMFLNKKGTQLSFLIDAHAAIQHSMIEFERAEQGKPFLSDGFRSATGLSEGDVAALTPGQRMSAAGKFADQVIGETHASSARGQEIGIQKSAPTRLLTKFQSEPMKAFENMRRALMDYQQNKSTFNLTKLVKTMTFYTVAEGVIFYGLDSVWNALFGSLKGNQVQQEKRAPNLGEEEALANLNYVPVVGPIASGAITRTKFPSAYTGNVGGSVEDLIGQTLDALAKLHQGEKLNEMQRANAMQKFVDGVTDIGLGVFGTSIKSPRSVARGIEQRLEK